MSELHLREWMPWTLPATGWFCRIIHLAGCWLYARAASPTNSFVFFWI